MLRWIARRSHSQVRSGRSAALFVGVAFAVLFVSQGSVGVQDAKDVPSPGRARRLPGPS
jgi:hypothetical protein